MILLLLSFVTAGIEECKGIIISQESPCYLLLTNTSGFNCESINVLVYNNASTFLYSQQMTKYSPFKCKAIFNQTQLGTYTFQYNSSLFIDTGSIIIEKSELNMLSIIIGIGMIILFFFAIAYMTKSFALKMFSYGMVIIEVITIAFILYANEIGNSLESILYTNFIITLFAFGSLGLTVLYFILIAQTNIADTSQGDTLLKMENVEKWQEKR